MKLLFLSVDGKYGEWHDISPCSQSCGQSGAKKQKRLCDNPQPRNGGKDCLDQHSLGPNIKTIPCNTHILCSSKYK